MTRRNFVGGYSATYQCIAEKMRRVLLIVLKKNQESRIPANVDFLYPSYNQHEEEFFLNFFKYWFVQIDVFLCKKKWKGSVLYVGC